MYYIHVTPQPQKCITFGWLGIAYIEYTRICEFSIVCCWPHIMHHVRPSAVRCCVCWMYLFTRSPSSAHMMWFIISSGFAHWLTVHATTPSVMRVASARGEFDGCIYNSAVTHHAATLVEHVAIHTHIHKYICFIFMHRI